MKELFLNCIYIKTFYFKYFYFSFNIFSYMNFNIYLYNCKIRHITKVYNIFNKHSNGLYPLKWTEA